MEDSYSIPNYTGEITFGLITEGGRIIYEKGQNCQNHVEVFGKNKIEGCDRFRIIESGIYITHRENRGKNAIREILEGAFPGKTIKRYQILVGDVLHQKRRNLIKQTSRKRGIGHYLAGIISGVHRGD